MPTFHCIYWHLDEGERLDCRFERWGLFRFIALNGCVILVSRWPAPTGFLVALEAAL